MSERTALRVRILTILIATLCGSVVARATQAGSDCPSPDACAESAWDEGRARVRGQLLLHPDDLYGNPELRIGVLLRMDPGWHVYAANPGDTGLPTEVVYRVEGGMASPLAWPRPATFRESDGMFVTRGYEDAVFLPALVQWTGAPASEPSVHATVSFLACNGECIPGSFALSTSVSAARSTDSAGADRVRAWFLKDGVVTATDPAPVAGAETSGTPALAMPFAYAVLLAFLGGLILNAMPCVLPVLAIKVFSITESAQRSPRAIRRHAAAYTAGILSSMAVLAGAVVLLRMAGHRVGWGFQFQDPRFVGLVCVVLVVFAMNLFGVFEIGVGAGRLGALGQQATGLRRSFFEGLLAVVLSTPCSAPFLGTAVGFALAHSALATTGIFLAIGAGLAAPFVAVSAIPGCRRFLPKPGRWMLELRSVLGFCLLATAVWLLWVVGRLSGSAGMTSLLVLLWGVAFAVWCSARWLQAAPGRSVLGVCVGLGGLALLGVNLLATENRPGPETQASVYGSPYSRSAVEEALGDGRPVFAYFTADWCVTCKVNEQRVLLRPGVQSDLAARNVAVLRGDWTRRDEAIRRELARFGRSGVPLYVVYRPDAPTRPTILSELLRVEELYAAIGDVGHQAAGPGLPAPVATSHRRDAVHGARVAADR